jgi:hypothetical protein
MVGSVPEYLVRMVRRYAPAKAVIPGITPVIAFGDPRRAEIATLGINPSGHEFNAADGSLLAGPRRRLSTLASLVAESAEALSEDQINIVVEECAAYFSRNPYRRWFDPLDQVLRNGLGASFYDASACHPDLVQWATAPAWGRLAPSQRQSLLDESLPHLRSQLRLENLRLVVLNGGQVIEQVTRVGLAELKAHGTLPINARLHCSLYSGLGEGVRFLGWSTNLQSSRGVTREFKNCLARWLAEAANRSEERVGNGDRSISAFEKAFDANGYVVKDTTVANKVELLQLLQAWLNTSDAPKISGAKPGRTPWIRMPLDHGRKVEINSDTKRSAVEEYVKNARAHGADLPWSVVPNRDGPYNKLVFRADREKTPGWYCYLRPDAVGPEEI